MKRNPDKRKAASKQSYTENPEAFKKTYAENKEKVKEASKKAYVENPEKFK